MRTVRKSTSERNNAKTFLTGWQKVSVCGKQKRQSLMRCKSRLGKCSTSISRTAKGMNNAFCAAAFFPRLRETR